MPPGRFVAGVTETSIGRVNVVGVCIPWSASRVRDSEDGREMWQDPREYLAGLTGVLSGAPPTASSSWGTSTSVSRIRVIRP